MKKAQTNRILKKNIDKKNAPTYTKTIETTEGVAL